MNPLYTIYTALTCALFFSCFPPFWIYTRLSGRYRKGLGERLGLVPSRATQTLTGSPRIWIHAVSLGEVKVAAPIIEALRALIPGCSVILSCTTDHGVALAKKTFGEDVPVLYAPIDTLFAVRTALLRVRPHVLVFLETEIWPAWIVEARRTGIRTALVNGRISVRSIGRYLMLKAFFREVLRHVDAFSMILQEDAQRIRAMGAEPHKIEVHGNAKYDLLARQADPVLRRRMERVLNLGANDLVFVAGSTRQGEEAMVLEAYARILKEFPDTVLVIAPRHIDRTPEIEALVKERGFEYQLRSQLRPEGPRRSKPVVIVDTFGELFQLYSVGTILFCGASLVPLGGQNPMEAAIWGKVVFYGPSMEDFADARALLENVGAGITVSSPQMLAEKAIWFLNRPEALTRYGEKARQAAVMNQNAAERHARVIMRLL